MSQFKQLIECCKVIYDDDNFVKHYFDMETVAIIHGNIDRITGYFEDLISKGFACNFQCASSASSSYNFNNIHKI